MPKSEVLYDLILLIAISDKKGQIVLKSGVLQDFILQVYYTDKKQQIVLKIQAI